MRNRPRTGSYIELMIAQIVIIALCVAYINHVYKSSILPDKLAKDNFVLTQCYLADKNLSENDSRLFHGYRANFQINYKVNGAQYSEWVSGNGLDDGFTRDLLGQQNIMSRFDIGIIYPCWYDPSKPEVAILVPRSNWKVFSANLILPGILGLIVLLFFIKNIFMLLTVLVKGNR